MRKKSLKGWVRRHRTDINAVIRSNGVSGKINDEDREDWVLNDEGLYNWAVKDGVEV